MKTESEVAVTLSADLYRFLRREARRLGISLEWLVASLLVESMDEGLLELPAALV